MPTKRKKSTLTGRTERNRAKIQKQNKRQDLDYQQKEFERDNSTRRARRSNESNLTAESSRDLSSLRARVSDPVYSHNRLERDNSTRRARRSDGNYQQNENERDNSSRRVRRSDVNYQQNEAERDNISLRARRNKPIAWNTAVETYEKNIRDGPCHRCCSCDKLIFTNQISMKTTNDKMIEKGYTEQYLRTLILEELYDSEEYTFCSTCNDYIKANKIPRFNINNSNLKFPVIPDEFKELDLQPLEERCVAARIPFMKLKALGCDRQLGITSGVVNVPIDVRRTIESIPARPLDSGVIELTLKRKTIYRSYYMKERVRPGAIWKAAQLLCNTELYKHEGITLNHAYESQDMNLQDPEPSSSNTVPNVETGNMSNSELQQTPTAVVPQNTEQENYIPEETLLDSNEGLNFAPGEGQIPIPMFLDQYCEELSFPTIFFGTARKKQPHS
ncbi:hypothetical protein PVAND_014343 [Polypedilum vanderplanki]|uniref:Uncharacterized protein n=1 Tax=Polypedilum vanderplanki TaxID=319348 RepID=A0A9J6CT88_POLVA|nr:hypothetical protein PVAND_014343 [Polypedilum vanderplanki]